MEENKQNHDEISQISLNDDNVDDGNDNDELSDEDWDYYSNFCEEIDENKIIKKDIENFDYKCVNRDEAKAIFESFIETIKNRTSLSSSFAKILLLQCKWDVNDVILSFLTFDNGYFESKGIKPPNQNIEKVLEFSRSLDYFSSSHKPTRSILLSPYHISSGQYCDVCFESNSSIGFFSLICGHAYCRDCWLCYIKTNIKDGKSMDIRCMRPDCQLFLPEDFIYLLLKSDPLLVEYNSLLFRECINTYEKIKPCTGDGCPTLILANENPSPKRVDCVKCRKSFCFQCGSDYHAPTDCMTIKLWYQKCSDDSETANYICVNTKLCPNCGACIEKNGGCNHMRCFSCKYEFCWICLGLWTKHQGMYYVCSKYNGKQEPKNETERAQVALNKYLFYYQRWIAHERSRQFENNNLQVIQNKIDSNMYENIQWQYSLLKCAKLLSKCRYTLQYTYPYAFYMKSGPQKDLFEYQQSELEKGVEDLAWKIEHLVESENGFETEMILLEKRRTTLLLDFFKI